MPRKRPSSRKPASRKPDSRKQSEWSRAYEQRLLDAGARRMPGGILPPEAVVALEYLKQRGYATSHVRCIARALIDAARKKTND